MTDHAELLKRVYDEAERRNLDPWLQELNGEMKIQVNGEWFDIETAARHLDIE